MDNRLEEYVSFIKHQTERQEAKAREQKDCLYPFVTISRETGAGGVTVGKKLVEYLKTNDHKSVSPWLVFDKDLVNRVIEAYDLPEKCQDFMHESRLSEIKDMIETMLDLHPPAFTLIREISETILHLAQVGHTVLVGRGANIITKKLKGGVHVRLVGSPAKRVRHCEEYYGLTTKEAKEMIKREDKGRKAYLKQHFNQDINNPMLYDMIINTDHISYEVVAKIIAEVVIARRDTLLTAQRESV